MKKIYSIRADYGYDGVRDFVFFSNKKMAECTIEKVKDLTNRFVQFEKDFKSEAEKQAPKFEFGLPPNKTNHPNNKDYRNAVANYNRERSGAEKRFGCSTRIFIIDLTNEKFKESLNAVDLEFYLYLEYSDMRYNINMLEVAEHDFLE